MSLAPKTMTGYNSFHILQGLMVHTAELTRDDKRKINQNKLFPPTDNGGEQNGAIVWN